MLRMRPDPEEQQKEARSDVPKSLVENDNDQLLRIIGMEEGMVARFGAEWRTSPCVQQHPNSTYLKALDVLFVKVHEGLQLSQSDEGRIKIGYETLASKLKLSTSRNRNPETPVQIGIQAFGGGGRRESVSN